MGGAAGLSRGNLLSVEASQAEFEVPMPEHEVCYRVMAADGVASVRVCVLPA